MFGLNGEKSRIWVYGGREFLAHEDQVEILRQGRWSLHRAGVSGKWTNYVLYFDPVGLKHKHTRVCWHLGYSGKVFSRSPEHTNLAEVNPEVLDWVMTAIVNCPDAARKLGVPYAPRRKGAKRKQEEGKVDLSKKVYVDVDAKIEEQIDRQWRIGVPLTRRNTFANVYDFCEERLGVAEEYVHSFLTRKIRQGRVKHDAVKGGYRLVGA